jgi:hypothetical protein
VYAAFASAIASFAFVISAGEALSKSLSPSFIFG